MMALLRADWIRFRRRRDLWVIAAGVVLISGIGFLNGYKGDVTDPPLDDPVQLRQVIAEGFSSSGMTQPEIDAQLDQMVRDQLANEQAQLDQRNEEQKTTLQAYGFPQSMFTIVGPGVLPLIALVLIASFVVGDEFRFGTLRTSLLASGDRRRFLAARATTLLGMTAGLLAVTVIVGAVLGIVLAAIGAELAVTTVPIDAVSAAAWFGGEVLVAVVVLCLGTALTVLLRSGAVTLLLILIWSLLETFLANLPIFAPDQPLAAVPMAFLTTNIRTLLAELGPASHAIGLSSIPAPTVAFALPTVAVVAIVALWGVLFLALADRRLRTMDVVE